MAAGIIFTTVTTTTGETVEMPFYVDNTASPTTWIPVALPLNTAGNPAAFGAGTAGATVPRVTLASDDTATAAVLAAITAGTITAGTVNAPGSQFLSTQPFYIDRTKRGKAKVAITASTSEVTLIAAAASTFNDIFFLAIWNTSATAANVTLRDDQVSGSPTVTAIIPIPAGGVGGFRVDADSPMHQALVNKPWTVQSDASVSSLQCTVMYVKNTV